MWPMAQGAGQGGAVEATADDENIFAAQFIERFVFLPHKFFLIAYRLVKSTREHEHKADDVFGDRRCVDS